MWLLHTIYIVCFFSMDQNKKQIQDCILSGGGEDKESHSGVYHQPWKNT